MTFATQLLRDPELKAYYAGRKEHLRKHPEIRKYYRDKRSRYLGSIPLNEQSLGTERHHIDRDHIVYIPTAMHRSVQHNIWTGRGMAEINAKACAWLTEDWT